MKLIRSITILLLFVLLGSNCKTYAQSNCLTSDELRQIANALNEHDFLVEQDSLTSVLLSQYAKIILEYKTKETLFIQKETSYKSLVTELTPSWYNNFLFGSTVTAIVFSLFLLALN